MYSVPVDLDPRSISTSIVYCRFGPPGPNLLVDMDPGVPFADLDPLQKLNICNVNQGSPNFIAAIDLSPYNQNFDLGNSRQIFQHSLKEHHKISNIPKFRCEMS